MIVVVLFTMLLLAALLAASSQLTLSSRRTTADQTASLRAQYVAESGVALAQSKLRDVQLLLSPSREGSTGTIDHMLVPFTTNREILKTQAEAFCNQVGNSSAWQPTTEFTQVPTETQGEFRSYPDATVCQTASGTNAAQFGLLAQYVLPAAFAVLPAAERPSDVNDYATRLQWWNNLFTQEQTVGGARYSLKSLRAVQLTPVKYRFYVQLDNLRIRGQDSNSTRVLAANRTADSQWWFEIELPSLLDDVLMTNHHRAKPSGTYSPTGAPGVNFTTQEFDGSIHTNEKFLFAGGSSAKFRGKVSSVGCTNLPSSGLATGGNCTATAGVHLASTSMTGADASATTAEQRDRSIADQIVAFSSSVDFVKDASSPTLIDYSKTDFTAAYKPLPANENDQRAAAESGGLLLGDAVGVELLAGDSSGNPLTEYEAGTPRADEGKWKETASTYQYIRLLKNKTTTRQECTWDWYSADYKQGNRWYPTAEYNSASAANRGTSGSGNSTRYYVRKQACEDVVETEVVTGDEYRYGADKKLYKKTASGGWSFIKNDFNGVIYGAKFDILRGPERPENSSDGAISKVPPALASFAGVTIASTNDVRIDSDLVMSNTPCTFAAQRLVPPCVKRPDNILGIYSQSGDVLFSTKTPNNLNIHAAIIASEGEVTVEGFDTRAPQGNIKLIGSLIENWYGAFGQFNTGNSAVLTRGYGRDFTYDQRLKEGIVPPFFPVSPRWKVEAAALTDPGKGLGNVVLRQAPASEF